MSSQVVQHKRRPFLWARSSCVPCPWGVAAQLLLLLLQVFKGIKNGVQEVAVKVLINSDEIQVQMFQEVSCHAETSALLVTVYQMTALLH